MDRSQPHSQHQALDHEAIRLQLDEIQSYLASITPNDPLSAEIIPVYRVYLEEMREVLRRETGERHDYLETELPTYGDAVEEGPAPAYVAEPEEERVLDEGIVNDMDGLDEFRDFVERRGLGMLDQLPTSTTILSPSSYAYPREVYTPMPTNTNPSLTLQAAFHDLRSISATAHRQDSGVSLGDICLQCNLCLTSSPESQSHVAPCGHVYDFKCLRTYLLNELNSPHPPRCCQGPVMQGLRTDMVLNGTECLLWREKEREWAVALRERVYCPSARCGAFVGSRTDVSTSPTCPHCNQDVCTKCYATSHPDRTCDMTSALQLLHLAAERGWRQCANCTRWVELKDGCAHVSCLCGHGFCYHCGAAWLVDVGGVGVRGCECTPHVERIGAVDVVRQAIEPWRLEDRDCGDVEWVPDGREARVRMSRWSDLLNYDLGRRLVGLAGWDDVAVHLGKCAGKDAWTRSKGKGKLFGKRKEERCEACRVKGAGEDGRRCQSCRLSVCSGCLEMIGTLVAMRRK